MPKLLQRARTDKRICSRAADELIARLAGGAGAREGARCTTGSACCRRPTSSSSAYPKFREKNGPNEYNPPAEDGSRPAVFFINAYQAEKKSRVEAESTAFHETIPGHHLQGAIALERKDIHPIGRYLGNSGYAEGWGLYAERLADEMKLFSTDLDRLGMLSSQALRAARLVVDSGIHTLGWTRQQAIDFMLAHTAEDPADVASEVDRYIIYPGQATAYMLGKLEISKARARGGAGDGREVRHQAVPRSRARGRGGSGELTCTRRSTPVAIAMMIAAVRRLRARVMRGRCRRSSSTAARQPPGAASDARVRRAGEDDRRAAGGVDRPAR